MKEAIWKKETLWVARGENGAIIRVSDTNPKEWVRPKAIETTEQAQADR